MDLVVKTDLLKRRFPHNYVIMFALLLLLTIVTGTLSMILTTEPMATSFSDVTNNTIRNLNYGGIPSIEENWQCQENGILVTYAGSVSGSNAVCDQNSFLYPIVEGSSGTSTEQWSASPLTFGLVAYWPLDEGNGTVVFDLSGNGNSGTLENSPTWISGAECRFGNCLNIADVNGQYISIGNQTIINTSSSNNFTFSAWIKPLSKSCSGSEFIASKDNGSIYPFYLSICDLSDYRFFENNGTNAIDVRSDAPITTNWTNVMVVKSGTTVSLYINGIFSASASNPSIGNTLCSDCVWAIGGNDGGGTNNLNGLIDDVRVYNRALSTSEVQELYYSTIPNLETHVLNSGNTYFAEYYHQYRPTFQITSSETDSAGFDGGMSLQITGTNVGAPDSNICLFTTGLGSKSSSCHGWVDNSSSVTFSRFLSNPPPYTSWQNIANSTSIMTVSNAGTYNAVYYSHVQKAPSSTTLTTLSSSSSGNNNTSETSTGSNPVSSNENIILIILTPLLIFGLLAALLLKWVKSKDNLRRKGLNLRMPSLESVDYRLLKQKSIAYLKRNWGAVPIFGFVALLVFSGSQSVLGLSASAENEATIAFYLLVVGVSLQIASFLKYERTDHSA